MSIGDPGRARPRQVPTLLLPGRQHRLQREERRQRPHAADVRASVPIDRHGLQPAATNRAELRPARTDPPTVALFFRRVPCGYLLLGICHTLTCRVYTESAWGLAQVSEALPVHGVPQLPEVVAAPPASRVFRAEIRLTDTGQIACTSLLRSRSTPPVRSP